MILHNQTGMPPSQLARNLSLLLNDCLNQEHYLIPVFLQVGSVLSHLRL